jgi:hypothetical protein
MSDPLSASAPLVLRLILAAALIVAIWLGVAWAA